MSGAMSGDRFNLSALALRHRTLVLFFMMVFGVAGAAAYFSLGRAEDPDFTIKVMIVSAQWPGATVEEMERQVTDRLEKELQEVPYYSHTVSFTRPGAAILKVNLKDATPPSKTPDVWYQVRKKLGDIRHTLPSGVIGPQFNDEFADVFGTIYALQGEGWSWIELKRRAEAIRQRLLKLPHVSKIDLLGVQDERIHLEISPRRLAQLGIPATAVFDAVARHNAVAPAGVVETRDERVALRVEATLDTLDALRAIPLAAGGRVLTVGDVAEVSRGPIDPPVARMRFDGRPALGIAISMVRDGNNLELGAALAAETALIRAELPAGLTLATVADQPAVVAESFDDFAMALAEALLIVLGVSFLSLGWRTGIVVALSVPLVLAITFLLMQAFGIWFHRISLGALIIALGLLVDDAIIAVEMMMVKMEEGMDRLSAAAHAYTATAFPMLTGTLVTAAGFIPVGLASGTVAQYTGAIFHVVGIALIVSWLIAVIFTPYLGFKLLPTPKPHQADAPETRWRRGIRAAVTWCVRRRWTVIGGTIAALALGLFAFAHVPQQFFPASSRLELTVRVQLPESASFAATERAAAAVEQALLADPGVAQVSTYVGSGLPRFYLPIDPDIARPNIASLVAVTKDTPARERLYRDLPALLAERAPEARIQIARLENGPPVGYPVQFRIVGTEPETLRRLGDELRAIVRRNPHVSDVHLEWGDQTKRVRLEIDHARARALGLDPREIALTLHTLLSGLTVTQARDGGELVDVVARAAPEERLELAGLAGLELRAPTGAVVPLEQVATLRHELEEPIFWRRNRDLQMTVKADIRDGTQAPDVTKQIQRTLGAFEASLPAGYRIEVGGAAEESAKGNAAIGKMMGPMVLVMAALLMIQLQSFAKLALVFVTAPLGVIGVAAALLAFGQPFGFVALLGTIALAGMIMRNTVILVDQIDQDLAAGADLWTAIIESSVRRARPIALTAATAILAMIPLSQNVFWGPMAVAIMGGLTSATVLTLLFVPALYAAWFRARRPEPASSSAAEMGILPLAAPPLALARSPQAAE